MREGGATEQGVVSALRCLLSQGGLLWRAIKLNIKLFRWERALALAQQANVHVDTVLWYRQRCARPGVGGGARDGEGPAVGRRHPTNTPPRRGSPPGHDQRTRQGPAGREDSPQRRHVTRVPCVRVRAWCVVRARRYLAAAQGEESIPALQELAEQLVVDEASVRTRIQEEKAREAQRPGAKRYV